MPWQRHMPFPLTRCEKGGIGSLSKPGPAHSSSLHSYSTQVSCLEKTVESLEAEGRLRQQEWKAHKAELQSQVWPCHTGAFP